ncbi:DUF4011 domain-containing protein [Glutamicibacter uratoxydans]|uniref:DUF4011 domain-containing protein n=1 Tax=Glutamicibacter uratoxydans TaxID=43667 RepID=UPI003D6DD0B2
MDLRKKTMLDSKIAGRSSSTAVGREKQWKNQLLDLTFRNRLLNFVPSTRFPLAVPGDSLTEFIEILENEKKFRLRASGEIAIGSKSEKIQRLADPDPKRRHSLLTSRRIQVPLEESTATRRLRALQRAAQTETQETGANNLFLAVATLHWELNAKLYVSPLILVPATLTSEANEKFAIEMDATSTVQTNLCLLEKLRVEFGIDARELNAQGDQRDGFNVESYIKSVKDALVHTGIQFTIQRSVDLAILQFSKFQMWKDIDEHWDEISQNAVIKHILNGGNKNFVKKAGKYSLQASPDLDILSEKCPLPADAAQLNAIDKAVSGESFILEGPPGTGKSQTITNMIAVAIAEGKRVLFVAEKKAALEVVKQRLNSVGLENHVLDLHDKDSRIMNVRRQIRVALQCKSSGKEGLGTDLSARLQAVRSDLNNYANKLHEKNSLGYSLYSAWTQKLAINSDASSSRIKGLSPVRNDYVRKATQKSIKDLRQNFEKLASIEPAARPAKKHPWGFIGADLLPLNVGPIIDASAAYTEALTRTLAHRHGQRVVTIIESLKSSNDLLLINQLLQVNQPTNFLNSLAEPGWRGAADDLLEAFRALLDSVTPIGRVFTREILAIDLEEAAVIAEQAARTGFLGIGRKKKIHEGILSLGSAWIGTAKDEASVHVALRMAQAQQLKAEDLRQQLLQFPGLESSALEIQIDERGYELLTQVIHELSELGNLWSKAREQLTEKVLCNIEFLLDQSKYRQESWRLLSEYSEKHQKLLVEIPQGIEAIFAWSGNKFLSECWLDTGWERRTDWNAERDIKAWVKFQQIAQQLSSAVSEEAITRLLSGCYSAEQMIKDFEVGLVEELLAERLETTSLDNFDPVRHERKITEFNRLSKLKRRQACHLIPDEIIRRREEYKSVNHARLKPLREAIKPGRLRTRELMNEFFYVITRVTPCVLSSPDSVARFFPADNARFDIVIFDEASQIRVADALGAIGRSTSVIVVGDSQQMPPTSFAMSSASTDQQNFDEVIVDEESILQECEQAGIPRIWLSGHYRSQSESLIAFSNRHFYDNRLTTFPAPRSLLNGKEDSGYGISLVRVDGHFHRSSEIGVETRFKRTNPVEARRVVENIAKRFEESRFVLPSLGVITFNAQHRDLIEDMIRDHPDPRMLEALELEDGLFVKNLENVQGDERDTIFFSTAFSPNDRGILPLNFGPLNNSGGERRLNVAVTRARKEVVVFSSFAPEQLRTAESESLGIKRLRDYLELAQKGTSVLDIKQGTAYRLDRHRENIARKLRARGLHVQTAVGLSQYKIDLVVSTEEKPEVPLVAIILDGEDWAARSTVAERDGLPQLILEGVLGWPATMRIWLPEWLNNPISVCNKVRAAALAAERQIATPQSWY